MEDKAPIPTPPAQRWREFRIQLLPFIVFALVSAIAALLWKRIVVPTNMLGEVASVQYQVRTPVDGLLLQLSVEPFSYVKKGDVIGSILPMEPANVQAQMLVDVSSLELERLRTGMNVNRNLLEFSTLELNRLKVASDLEVNKSDLQVKKTEFERVKALFEKNLQSKELYDVKQTDYEKTRTLVDQLATQLAGYEVQLKTFKEGQQILDMRGQSDAVDKAIVAKSNQLAVVSRPLPLLAPADGIISSLLIHSGERARMGDSIAVISATNAPYIIGYLRQPLGAIPNVNDPVQVRSRGTRRMAASGKVLKVGSQVDFINPAILSPDNTRKEKALSILVSVPAELKLHPGEYVDLSLVKD